MFPGIVLHESSYRHMINLFERHTNKSIFGLVSLDICVTELISKVTSLTETSCQINSQYFIYNNSKCPFIKTL